jgi:hypothetical protein
MQQQFGDATEEKESAGPRGGGGAAGTRLSARDRRLLGWHWANLEYGRGLTLVHLSAQSEPFLTQNTPRICPEPP